VIVDKNVKVGDGCTIIGSPDLEDHEGDGYTVKQGIIIIQKGAVIPANTHIGAQV